MSAKKRMFELQSQISKMTLELNQLKSTYDTELWNERRKANLSTCCGRRRTLCDVDGYHYCDDCDKIC